jgi:hypothetical protein
MAVRRGCVELDAVVENASACPAFDDAALTRRPAASPAHWPAPSDWLASFRLAAYVRGILDQAAALPAAPIYLITGPDFRSSKKWPAIAAALADLLPGVEFATWADPTAQPAHDLETPARCAYLAATHRGAVVLPKAHGGRHLIGPAAKREAEAFAAIGRAVLVYTAGRPTAWPNSQLRGAKPSTPWYRHELLVPAESDKPLPTLAASIRVITNGATP